MSLAKIAGQSRPVDHLLVVDNGSDASARGAAEAVGAFYLDAGDNRGPAGGIALGMRHILERAQDDDWLVLFDDDDPPRTSEMLDRLWRFGQQQHLLDAQTAAVGLVGARYDFRRGVTRRVADEDLSGPVLVNYIGGGQLPLFRCDALRKAGVFDERLFFGFDDLEHGLRLGHAGYSLYVEGSWWLEERMFHQRTGQDAARPRTVKDVAPWRRYYSVRNAVLIARRYCGTLTAVAVGLVGAVKGGASTARGGGRISEWFLPARGAVHGLIGLYGRRVDPGQNRKRHHDGSPQ
ncbi:glycosyl transferase family 2 [Humibacillus xanthopallidus]|uniref:Glycosyl transferase family 2 n=1 Tax=Humibacillus xanthopallidus TaxID=412689 RepID=A0A543PXL1_9MICO|nr:glycosyl transferase family 2 [Humibacillus xanthopallidus]